MGAEFEGVGGGGAFVLVLVGLVLVLAGHCVVGLLCVVWSS